MIIKNLSKQYDGKTVVDDVTFHIPKGKVISMIGPNVARTSSSGTTGSWPSGWRY